MRLYEKKDHLINRNNYLRSLEGAPKEIIGNLDCRRNISLNSLKGIGTVKEEIYKDF